MDRDQAMARVRELVKDMKFCMLTSVDDSDGTLHSRPMALQEAQYDGDLWFFTSRNSAKSREIRGDQHVNVSFADPDSQKYVSLSGRATLIDDRDKARELWNPMYKAWFPGGLDDPNLTLLKVELERAEYWDSPNGIIAHAIALAKRMAGGGSQAGEHQKIDVRP